MNVNIVYYLYCAMFTALLVTGCATPQDVGKIQWNFNDLRSEVNEIKRQFNSLDKQMPGKAGHLNERLQGLEEEQKATGRALSDLMMQMQAITSEFQLLTGRFEEARYFSEKTSRELTESKDVLIAQLKDLEITVTMLKEKFDKASIAVEKQKPPAIEPGKEQPKQETKTVEGNEKDIYMDAYRDYTENRFSEARKKFHALIKDYPESKYSDNARFWIGESYYREKNYEDAILAYEELFKANPKSDKVPGAMLKQGLSFYELKDKGTGRLILEKLIEKFPDSEQATLAKKKISPNDPDRPKRSVPPKTAP